MAAAAGRGKNRGKGRRKRGGFAVFSFSSVAR
jgi:hypothetical protein